MKKLMLCTILALGSKLSALQAKSIPIRSHHKKHVPCPMMFEKKSQQATYRYCVFTKLLAGHAALLPSRDMIIDLAKDLVSDSTPLVARGIFSEMAQPLMPAITFRITVKLDFLVALEGF